MLQLWAKMQRMLNSLFQRPYSLNNSTRAYRLLSLIPIQLISLNSSIEFTCAPIIFQLTSSNNQAQIDNKALFGQKYSISYKSIWLYYLPDHISSCCPQEYERLWQCAFLNSRCVIMAPPYHAILSKRKWVSLESHLTRVLVSPSIKKGSWTRSLWAIKFYYSKRDFYQVVERYWNK